MGQTPKNITGFFGIKRHPHDLTGPFVLLWLSLGPFVLVSFVLGPPPGAAPAPCSHCVVSRIQNRRRPSLRPSILMISPLMMVVRPSCNLACNPSCNLACDSARDAASSIGAICTQAASPPIITPALSICVITAIGPD
jgi:hypothetical protein